MSIVAWIAVGALAGYLAAAVLNGDERLGVVGHVVLGIVGAVGGGFVGGTLFEADPIQGELDAASLVTALIGALVVAVVASTLMSRSHTGRGVA